MGQHKKQGFRQEKDFAGRLQSDATGVVKAAEYLVENKVAEWQIVAFPDDTQRIALVFSDRLWELKDNKLTLKPKKSESGQASTMESE